MKNKILPILFGLTIICLVALTGFNSPTKQYTAIYSMGDGTVQYWDNTSHKQIRCTGIDEAMTNLSYNGYDFVSFQICGEYKVNAIIIMSK